MISEINNAGIVSNLKTYQLESGKLSSGSRLNSAGDGAAEIAISNLLRGDLAAVETGLRNIWDGISMLQIADGSLDTISRNLARMKELTLQAANGVYSPAQKQMIQQELDDLSVQNVQFGEMTKFNGIRLHKDNQAISITAAGDKITTVYSKSIEYFTVDVNNVESSIGSINMMIDHVSSYRASLGSNMNKLENAAAYFTNKAEEILESQSRIADTDIASTVTSMTSAAITAEAGIIQAHSNIDSQLASKLL